MPHHTGKTIRMASGWDEHTKSLLAEGHGLRTKIEQMLAEAERTYQDAAAMHALGKVSHAGGRIAALKDVLKLVE